MQEWLGHGALHCFPCGPGHGALCPTCLLPATPMDITLTTLPEESKSFLHFHQILVPEPKQLPPAFSRLLFSVGCRATNSYVPCVLCQGGFNYRSLAILLSSCAPHLACSVGCSCTRDQLAESAVPQHWRSVSILRHLARCSTTSVLHHNRAVLRVLTPLRFERSASPRLYLKRPCSRQRDLQRLSPLQKETRLLRLLSRITAFVCSFHNTESFPFPQQPHVSSPFHATAEPHTYVCKPWTICLQILFLLLGEPQEWQGCFVQFDGSAHKHTQTGGAGVSLLHATPSSTSLVQWLSIPSLSCSDNEVQKHMPVGLP